MFCTNCGSQLDDKAVICPHCGCATENYYKPAGPANPAGTLHAPQNAVPPAQSKPINGFAIAGLVLGIVGFWLGAFFGIVNIAGLIFSILGISSASKTNSGRGIAIGGLVTSIIGIAFWAIIWFMVLVTGGIVYYY